MTIRYHQGGPGGFIRVTGAPARPRRGSPAPSRPRHPVPSLHHPSAAPSTHPHGAPHHPTNRPLHGSQHPPPRRPVPPHQPPPPRLPAPTPTAPHTAPPSSPSTAPSTRPHGTPHHTLHRAQRSPQPPFPRYQAYNTRTCHAVMHVISRHTKPCLTFRSVSDIPIRPRFCDSKSLVTFRNSCHSGVLLSTSAEVNSPHTYLGLASRDMCVQYW